MKKKLIVISIVVIVLLSFSLGMYFKIKKDFEIRYEEIRKDIDKELQRYVYLVSPHCKKGQGGSYIGEKELIYNAGMDKEVLLDVDKKSYCQVMVLTKCVDNDKWDWDIKFNCKYRTDKGYIDWWSEK